MTWTAGIGFGYDDNAIPLSSLDDQDSWYGTAYVGASFLSRDAVTTTEFFARIGIVHYFTDLETGPFQDSVDQSSGRFQAEEISPF